MKRNLQFNIIQAQRSSSEIPRMGNQTWIALSRVIQRRYAAAGLEAMFWDGPTGGSLILVPNWGRPV